jgi:hypothetical protein
MPVWPSLTAAGADVAGARRLLLLAPLVTCCYRIHLPHQRNRCGASPGFQIEIQHSSGISSVGPLTAHLARFGRTCACEPCEALRIERRTNMTSFETGHFDSKHTRANRERQPRFPGTKPAGARKSGMKWSKFDHQLHTFGYENQGANRNSYSGIARCH